MTQKFHENETATIALYKYHQLLDCEQKLTSFARDVDWEVIADVKKNILSGDYFVHESAASLNLLIGYLIGIIESMKF